MRGNPSKRLITEIRNEPQQMQGPKMQFLELWYPAQKRRRFIAMDRCKNNQNDKKIFCTSFFVMHGWLSIVCILGVLDITSIIWLMILPFMRFVKTRALVTYVLNSLRWRSIYDLKRSVLQVRSLLYPWSGTLWDSLISFYGHQMGPIVITKIVC